jgi:putative ABC transport system ATP-binding protein
MVDRDHPRAAGMALFTFEDVHVELGGRDVLRGVDAEVPDGALTTIVGPSGSGKSTLLRLCNRLAVPSRGRVLLRGTDVTDLDVLAMRRRVGMVFQAPTLFAGTVRDNLAVAAPDAAEDRWVEALARAELDRAFLDRDADTLSGGEAQRACLARTLVTGPEVLLADEPTSSLDQATARALERMIRALVDDGVAVLWVTHDPAQSRRLADWTLALERGQVVAMGDPAEVNAHLGAVEEA